LRLLVAGFPPFSGRPVNPSQWLVDLIDTSLLLLPGVHMVAKMLPVEYARICLCLSQLRKWE